MDERLNDGRLSEDLLVAGPNAEYDGHAKQLLAHKIVLAHILVGTVPEFKGFKPEDVSPLIEREPEIASVPVNPGVTNVGKANAPLITRAKTESEIPNEGMVTFDVRFFVWAPGRKEKVKMCYLSEAILDEGMEKGQFQQLYELIQSGDISIERAAERKNMCMRDLQKIFIDLKIPN